MVNVSRIKKSLNQFTSVKKASSNYITLHINIEFWDTCKTIRWLTCDKIAISWKFGPCVSQGKWLLRSSGSSCDTVTTRWIWNPNWGKPLSSLRPLLRLKWAGMINHFVLWYWHHSDDGYHCGSLASLLSSYDWLCPYLSGITAMSVTVL